MDTMGIRRIEHLEARILEAEAATDKWRQEALLLAAQSRKLSRLVWAVVKCIKADGLTGGAYDALVEYVEDWQRRIPF